MKIEIQAPWKVNDKLRTIIHNKVEKFSTYIDSIIHTDVFLKVNEKNSPNDKIAEIRVSLPGPYIFAEGNGDTHEKAVASAAEKIRKQLLKKKEKLQDKK